MNHISLVQPLITWMLRGIPGYSLSGLGYSTTNCLSCGNLYCSLITSVVLFLSTRALTYSAPQLQSRQCNSFTHSTPDLASGLFQTVVKGVLLHGYLRDGSPSTKARKAPECVHAVSCHQVRLTNSSSTLDSHT
jgi:hypothetical protein